MAQYLSSPASSSSSGRSSKESNSDDSDTDSDTDSRSEPDFDEEKFSAPMPENLSSLGNNEETTQDSDKIKLMKRPRITLKRSASSAKSNDDVAMISTDNDNIAPKRKRKILSEEAKKMLFQRIWNEEDEIEILNGMIEFTSNRGTDPASHMNSFYIFIKDFLTIDVTKSQLTDKIRRLKKKFATNAIKKIPVFSKPHEQKVYELSKQIWYPETKEKTSDEPNEVAQEKQGESKKKQFIINSRCMTKVDEHNADFSRLVRVIGSIGESSLEEDIVRNGLELMNRVKMSQLEMKWKKLRVQQLELYLQRVDLIREQTKLALEVLKSTKNEDTITNKLPVTNDI